MDKELQSLQKFYNLVIEFLTQYSFQLIGAVLILILGWFASKYAYLFVIRIFDKHHFDSTLSRFIANVVKVLILSAMIVVALGKIGISIAPFVAALGAVSLTAGLALQSSVSNYAAGVLLIISRPFKVGDTLLVGRFYGVVEDIKLSYTLLRNEDEECITIPNKQMIGDVLVNSSDVRIVESSLKIAYTENPEHVIGLIKETLSSHQDVSKEHHALVGIASFGENAFEIGLRYWIPTKRFYKLQYEINLAIYTILNTNGIKMTVPPKEVYRLGGSCDSQKI